MTTLAEAWELSRPDSGLAVVSTLRADGTIQATLVNTGIIEGGRLALVAVGRVKLANLRHRPQTAVTFRAGWRWATVEGTALLLGPDDPGLDPERLRLLLREIFTAAGGTHEDWDEYDRVMREERRTAVLITPTRIYGD
jgi:PPOX class probable F420-dependent enzyme